MPEHEEHPDTPPYRYRIVTGSEQNDGATSGDNWEPNVFASIENIGKEAVLDPWIAVDGKNNWRTTQDILDGILTPQMTDDEKIVAIRAFVREHRYPIGDETEDGEAADPVKLLNIYGYADEHDTQTATDQLLRSVGLAPEYPDIGNPVDTHRMTLTLRPGETLIWEWEHREKFHGYGACPSRLCNGGMLYTPPINTDPERWCEAVDNLSAFESVWHPVDPTTESSLVYLIRSPYVIVGGKIVVAGQAFTVEHSGDGNRWTPVPYDGDPERPRILPIDRFFPSASPARYEYFVRFRGVNCTIKRILIETDTQMAPLSLPALKSGENEVVYSDRTSGPRQVRVVHGWYERLASR
ncbi:MAG: hypothetical protein FJY97_02815 [candidate division Zixibacteria bacterium]|nr:hypothetical protein [candidate division Zixibacteria bacterium]